MTINTKKMVEKMDAEKARHPRPEQGDTIVRPVEGLLNEEELAEVRELAKLKVELEYKDAERKVLLERFIQEERGKHDPEEEIVPTQVMLPGHALLIRINAKPYYHGMTYDVPMSVHRTLIDVMARAWEHEDVVGNVNRKNPPVRNASVGRGGTVTNSNLLRV